MATNKERISVTLPSELVKVVERESAKVYQSKSQWIVQLIAKHFQEKEAFEEKQQDLI